MPCSNVCIMSSAVVSADLILKAKSGWKPSFIKYVATGLFSFFACTIKFAIPSNVSLLSSNICLAVKPLSNCSGSDLPSDVRTSSKLAAVVLCNKPAPGTM